MGSNPGPAPSVTLSSNLFIYSTDKHCVPLLYALGGILTNKMGECVWCVGGNMLSLSSYSSGLILSC